MTNFPKGSAQQVSILSLTDLNRSIWRSPKQLSAGVTIRGPRRPILLWDLHALADTIASGDTDNYKQIDASSEFWYVLWPSSFSDNAGSGVLKALPTVFAVNPFNTFVASANHYTASLTFNPVVGRPDPLPQNNDLQSPDTGYNEIASAESVIYDLCTTPAYPIVVATTLPEHQTYGPLFMESASFSVSGDGAPGPVEVNVQLTGGKALRLESRDKLDFEIVQQNQPVTDSDNDGSGDGNDNDADDATPIMGYRNYRKANLTDCLAGFVEADSISAMRDAIAGDVLEEAETPARRLISMSLEIAQRITLRSPTPAPPRTDDQGPRYAQIESFDVTGTLKFYSREKRLDIHTGSLTLYFGGTFLFCMPNVDFGWPTLNLQSGKGYIHEVKFIARAPKNTVTRAYLDGGDTLPVSQFAPLAPPQNVAVG